VCIVRCVRVRVCAWVFTHVHVVWLSACLLGLHIPTELHMCCIKCFHMLKDRHKHTHSLANTLTHTHLYAHILSLRVPLSLSLSLSHTHTHTPSHTRAFLQTATFVSHPAGADAHAYDAEGRNALMLACRRNKVGSQWLLLVLHASASLFSEWEV